MRNFNATVVGQPYTRILRIGIAYQSDLSAAIEVEHQEHVPLVDGSHRAVGAVEVASFSVSPDQAATEVELHQPGTDAAIGRSIPLGYLFAGIFSALRERL